MEFSLPYIVEFTGFALFAKSSGMTGCVPGTAHVLKVSQAYQVVTQFGKSQTQPDGGEGCSGRQQGAGDGTLEGSRPAAAGYREGTG